MHRRPSLGPATFYVATLVVVLVAVGLFAVARSQERPLGSPAPGALSPLDEALQGINDDGTWSKDTALAVFAAAFGPLPGVPAPRADPSYHSGTLAIRMVEAHWAELTDAQRQAVRDDVGPEASAILPASYRPTDHGPDAVPFDTWQSLVDANAADIATKFGRPLGIPITVVAAVKDDPGGAWAWAHGNWNDVPAGSHASKCIVTIPPSTYKDASRGPFMRWVLMHEVWHCFEYTMLDEAALTALPAWVTEGEASFVAEAITGGVGAPPPELDHWDEYLLDPGRTLYKRSYDAVGFYPQLTLDAIDPWKVLEPMATSKGSDAAFQASGANATTFADSWGSSYFRDAQPSGSWAMTNGYGIQPLTHHATSKFILLQDGDEESIEAKPLTVAIADVHTTAFVTRIEVPVGTGRVGEPKGGGLDKVLRGATLDLCTNPDGDCTCPSGSGLTETPPERGPAFLRIAATGEEHTTSTVDLRGLSKDEWCHPKPSSSPPQVGGNPCPSGCGGSNGDPHLRTVDGVRYDLQSAGEYVLLRASDGSVEIQGRQERPDSGGSATIGSAVAVKVNGHRVGFYAAGAGPPDVHVDGAVVDADKAASTDLGAGATLTGYERGYELDLPDGTKVWALSIGHWGINLLVLPSAALRATGVGLIAHIPSNAGLRVPALPDGSVIPLPIARSDRYHDLYEVLAPAWRVTASTSLFDYAPGTTTDSFTLAGFPPPAVPQSIDDLDPAAVAGARTTCAGVKDPDLADQCAYDVSVTGSTEYATLYQVTDTFQTQGTASLDQPPSGSSPSPSVGPLSAGVNLVEDHLGGVGRAALAPNGTVYVTVGEQGAAFGDVKPMLLAVDSTTGKVRQKAVSVMIGGLAWAAGSVWAGEFKRGDTGCEVSRLDPVTLADLADVPTVCNDRDLTDFAAVGDAIWFVDRTGADANGAGGHLRRIDPATNKVDTSPTGTVDLPFVPQAVGVPGTSSVLASTSDGLIVGDHQHGFYRLSTGGGSFEEIALPDNPSTLFPAGTGVWTQTEIGTSADPAGVATFASSDAGSATQVGISGDLVGADDAALYASQSQDDQQPEELWRFPIDRSSPTRVAIGGFAPNPFGGQVRLLYRDAAGPLLIGDKLAVKLWQSASSTGDAQLVLVMQAIPLP